MAAGSASSPPDPASGRAHLPRPTLEAARRQAARACLRSRDDPPPVRQPYVQPAISVPPQATARPPRPLALPREAQPPVVRPLDRPRLHHDRRCDRLLADPTGSRLDRVGPDLRGPRGPCTLQGTLLTCP